MKDTPQIFYRYRYYSQDDGILMDTHIVLDEYILKRETPAGYWIGWKYTDKPYKWIPKVSKKRFAYPTKEEALTNLIKRTQFRKRILNAQLRTCELVIEKANKIKVDNETIIA